VVVILGEKPGDMKKAEEGKGYIIQKYSNI
jgi:hypothetical protein